MKELSIEQKAKAYDKAISMAKKFYTPDSNNVNLKATLEMIFPELKDEDERMRKGIIRNLEYLANRAEGFVKDDLKEKIAWLEKQGEQKPAWSEEDDDKVKEIIGYLNAFFYNYSIGLQKFNDYKTWFNSLKERVQPKQGLSEEYEEHIESILKRLDGMCKKGATFTQTCFAVNQDMDWLKSIRPQKQWKPSKEQLKSLEIACDRNDRVGFNLAQLLKELKKL